MKKENKKPWYKKIWVWALIVYLIGGVVYGAMDITAFIVKQMEPSSKEVFIEQPIEAQCVHSLEIEVYEATCWNGKYQINKCTKCNFEERIELSKRKLPVQFIYNYYEMDYVGGVTLNFTVKNFTNKTIKYIYFDVTFYNAVNDVIRCDIDGKYTHHWQITGPIEESIRFRPTGFYNKTFNGTIVLDNVQIIFMDNSKITITDDAYEGELLK